VTFLCDIGLHRYVEYKPGESIHRYLRCQHCWKRTVQLAASGYQPMHQAWLDGGAWDEVPPLPPAARYTGGGFSGIM
jgi:hypothetical protein